MGSIFEKIMPCTVNVMKSMLTSIKNDLESVGSRMNGLQLSERLNQSVRNLSESLNKFVRIFSSNSLSDGLVQIQGELGGFFNNIKALIEGDVQMPHLMPQTWMAISQLPGSLMSDAKSMITNPTSFLQMFGRGLPFGNLGSLTSLGSLIR